jgi:hypothetical protein
MVLRCRLCVVCLGTEIVYGEKMSQRDFLKRALGMDGVAIAASVLAASVPGEVDKDDEEEETTEQEIYEAPTIHVLLRLGQRRPCLAPRDGCVRPSGTTGTWGAG